MSCSRLILFGLLLVPLAGLADERVSALLVRIPESVGTVFVAETASSAFHRFSNVDGAIVHSGSYYMSIGEAGSGKQRAGDKRTPLGVYFVTEQLDTSRLHEKYGVTAFPLDYPNALDRSYGRAGDGIWVHGVDRRGGRRPALDTDGCIALPNDDLAELISLFEENVTPVLITAEMPWTDADQTRRLRSELEAHVTVWAESFAAGDLYTYLSLYADDFERWGMSKEEWSSLNLQTTDAGPPRAVEIQDLLLLAYPEEDGLYFSRFRQVHTEGGREIEIMKRIYWRRDERGALQIIAENEG